MRKKIDKTGGQNHDDPREIQTYLDLGKTNVYMGAKDPPHNFVSFRYCLFVVKKQNVKKKNSFKFSFDPMQINKPCKGNPHAKTTPMYRQLPLPFF